MVNCPSWVGSGSVRSTRTSFGSSGTLRRLGFSLVWDRPEQQSRSQIHDFIWDPLRFKPPPDNGPTANWHYPGRGRLSLSRSCFVSRTRINPHHHSPRPPPPPVSTNCLLQHPTIISHSSHPPVRLLCYCYCRGCSSFPSPRTPSVVLGSPKPTRIPQQHIPSWSDCPFPSGSARI